MPVTVFPPTTRRLMLHPRPRIVIRSRPPAGKPRDDAAGELVSVEPDPKPRSDGGEAAEPAERCDV